MRCRSHPNIVTLLKVVQGKHNAIFLVFEYCEHDIGKLMQTMRAPFQVSEVKTLTIQLLSAVSFLHGMHVFHRDLKMSNLLLNNRGELRLCDLVWRASSRLPAVWRTARTRRRWSRCGIARPSFFWG